MNNAFKVIVLMAITGVFGTPIRICAAESLEHQLAIINAKGYVADNDITVARFRSLLEQLSTTFHAPKQEIADTSVKALELLNNNGIDESLLKVMEGMNQIFPGKADNQKYSQILAYYITLRNKGRSHVEAIEDLRGLIQALSEAGR